MSAFMVENKCISRVLIFLQWYDLGSHWRRIICAETGHWVEDDEQRLKLGQEMHDLNRLAVNTRYTPEQVAEHWPDGHPYREEYNHCDMMQAYKSLQCWLYQCSEGKIPEESKLYAVMEQVKYGLADRIVSELPAYEAAKWG